jgi:uncharacterized membrane protein YozB (DUF420 family)
MMNKLAHGVVLAFFGLACWFVWVCFRIPAMVRPGLQLPAFTRLCISVGPAVVISLAVVATAYCVWVWCRRGESRNSWVAFLATTTSALLFVMLPNAVATSLALINAVNNLAIK